jgi:L-lactate utilization protein LutC
MTSHSQGARDEILSKVRAALAGTAPTEPPHIPAGVSTSSTDLVPLFMERVADYQATVERCSKRQLPARLKAALPDGRVVVPVGLSVAVPDAVVDGQPGGLSPDELDACAAVVTDATVGIAETGTIVLDHGPGQGRRAITLVPDVHVCIVRADQVVADVPDAMPRLDPVVRQGRPLTWISGPSATSDIELSRVEGVHGPRTLHVLVVSG